MFASFAVTEIH